MKIGIAYTVRNRNKIASKSIYNCIETIKNDWHKPVKLCIVDDASFDAFLAADFRFEKNVGVSIAKNKCLQILYDADCTDFFLFDDDIFPIVNNWTSFYTQSPLNHCAYTFNQKVIETGGIYTEFEKPNGCMMYFKRICLDTVGGWDTSFKGYGYEHVNVSDRIYNAGLTPARYIDIPNTAGLFEMADCESSFTSEDRMQIPTNFKLYQQKYYSKEFKPFK